MTEIFFLRHGETVENAAGYYQGQTAGHLSERGVAQAKAVAERVQALGVDRVLCSDLGRTRHTASIVLKGTGLPVVYTQLLRERDMGNLTGKTIVDNPLDDTVENLAQCAVRAREFLHLVREQYAGRRILAISHGYFLRVMLSVATGKPYDDIQRIDNCELRHIVL